MERIAWRIVDPEFLIVPADPFNGVGAAKNGGRWNSQGMPAVYLAGSLALATLEVLVYALKLDTLLNVRCCPLHFETSDVTEFIPSSGDDMPSLEASRTFGDRWLGGKNSPVLRVPSAVIPIEHNFVMNPEHPEFPRIRATATEWKPLPIDPRLLEVK